MVGAASASARGDARHHRASYHLYTITRDGTGYAVAGVERGLTETGNIADLGPLKLTRS
ncbi:hypothetical protein CFIICLFH_4538 [Methylobacterium goesingense]|nr:hypothetical protein CFIICLFH_4538 [Methylobacterium goesingense]